MTTRTFPFSFSRLLILSLQLCLACSLLISNKSIVQGAPSSKKSSSPSKTTLSQWFRPRPTLFASTASSCSSDVAVESLRQPALVTLPVGATYVRTLPFPFLGQQTFQLHVLSDTTARLQVNGMLSVDEVVAYGVDETGCMSFALSDSTRQIMRRLKTKIVEAGYEDAKDAPYFCVAALFFPSIKVSLKRARSS